MKPVTCQCLYEQTDLRKLSPLLAFTGKETDANGQRSVLGEIHQPKHDQVQRYCNSLMYNNHFLHYSLSCAEDFFFCI